MRPVPHALRPASARVAVLLGIAALAAAVSGPALAHRQGPAGSTAGLAIPAVTHGQMDVLADHRDAILALAAAQDQSDRTLRRLEGYVALQHFACGWGLVPGTREETSPFNECSHAELAGVRAILVRLGETAGTDSRVQALTREVGNAMLQHHAALVLCRYSEEPFNTADVVPPRWTMIGGDPPSLAIAAALALALGAGGAWTVRYRTNRKGRHEAGLSKSGTVTNQA